MDKQEQAAFLIEAMPYIKKYFNKILVVKYGGNAMTDESLKSSVMRDLVVLNLLGIKIVLVHGGGPEITATIKKWVKKRYLSTDSATLTRKLLKSFAWCLPER